MSAHRCGTAAIRLPNGGSRHSASFWAVALGLLFGLFFLSMPARAQDDAVLRGLVTAADDGTALISANVLLLTPEGNRAAAAVTDADGFYELRRIDPGRYHLEISYLGYETHRDTLALAAGPRQYNVRLSPTTQQLAEVEVEAERGGATRRTAGLQRAGPADLARVPTPGSSGDLAAYLQTLPGVVSIGDRGGQLYIRGGTPSQNLALVDGHPIVKPFHMSGLYSTFPEQIVKTVDVYAGGYGAEYMGAISSVVDVSLRKGNLQAYEGSVSISPYLASARIEGPIRKGTDSFLAVARRSLIEETAGPLYGRNVPLGFYDLTARYSLQMESATCSATGMFSSDRGRINPSRSLDLTWSNAVLGGRCLLFGEGMTNPVTLRAGYTRFENAAATPNSAPRTASLEKVHLSAESEQEFVGTLLKYGGRWIVTSYRYNLDERFTALQMNTQSGGAFQGYASMEWDISNRLTLTPSFGTHLTVRRLRHPTYEPRLRASFHPDGTDRMEVSLALGKYNQPAQGLTDERDAGTVFTVWRPSEAAEFLLQALHGILGYRHEFGSDVQLSVEGYAKDLSNIPVPTWSPIAQFDVRTTLADGLAYGFDLRAELNREALYFFLGYGWSKVHYQAARDDLGAWIGGEVFEYPPSHDRRHQLNLLGTYTLGDFTFSLNWKLATGRPYTRVAGFDLAVGIRNQSAFGSPYPTVSPGTAQVFYQKPYSARLPSYHRLDVSLTRRIELSSTLTVEAEIGTINTYNRRNVFYYDITTFERVDQTPILPYLSVRLQIR